MLKFTKIFVYLFVFCAVLSCGTKTVEPEAAPIDILTGGSSKAWIATNYKSNGVVDFESCENDDVITFNKSTMKATTDVGAKKCFTGETGSSSTFTMSADGKTLSLDGFGFTVVKLTNTELELRIELFGSKEELFFKAK